MIHVVHCHYCCAYHSHLDNYRFDDHHDHDHVIDVLMNLDDRVMNDDHYDVHLNVNEFDLQYQSKKLLINFIYHNNKIHTTFMFSTSTSTTIYNKKKFLVKKKIWFCLNLYTSRSWSSFSISWWWSSAFIASITFTSRWTTTTCWA